ncbi:MAG TPA: hypothetical protein VET88_09025 [Gammaproteobacteria bacterium]|nr:hypothetical protein [Gammaproteobacteria bacterium]
MSPNSTDTERKALRDIVEQLENPVKTLRKQKLLQRTVLGIGYVGLLVGFILAWHQLVGPVAASLIVAFSGAAVGMGVFMIWSESLWPVTVKYVDLERIKQRLDELET